MARGPGRADLMLRGGTVVDGTGAPPRRAGVAVSAGRIAAVGDLSGWSAEDARDVTGLVVAPGFIDMHSHSDLSLLINPRAESKLRQGITTEVIGQCGGSPAPAAAENRERIRALFGTFGQQVEWTWESFGDYLGALRGRGLSLNVVPLVGHNVVRAGVMGEDNQAPTAAELSAMQEMVGQAMQEGAFGLSSGLIYVPGMWAETEELIALAQAMAPWKGIYFTHMRNERERLVEAVEEAITIGREGGVGVEIAHLKSADRPNWGRLEGALGRIEQARERGEVELSYDAYPYTAWNTGLGQVLPPWAREGGVEAMMGRLQDSQTRAQLRQVLAEEAAADPGRWDRRLLASVGGEANRELQGLTFAEIAARRGTPPEDMVMDLLVEERGQADMVGFAMSEEDVQAAIAHPIGLIGSDAAARAPYGELGRGHPHPRAYGTFPRVLARYVREEKALSLESAVAKMTGLPAAKLGLRDRGQIAPGMAADLVVFDSEAVADRATYDQPARYPEGIHLVIVNGVIELAGEEHQGRGPGGVLQRPAGG